MARLLKPEEVRVVKRGRKAQIRQELVDLFKDVKPGVVVLLDTEFSDKKYADSKGRILPERKGSVNSVIRKHWELAKPNVPMRISYTEDGQPTVQISEK